MRILIPIHLLLSSVSVKFILILSFLFGVTAAQAGPMMNRINQLEELQQKIKTHCLNNPNRDEVQLVINGTTLTCDHLIVLANRLRDQLEEDVTELQESCDQSAPGQTQTLARDTAAVAGAVACRPVSTDSQCLPMYACAAFTMTNPLATLIGGAQRLAGNRNSCLARGSAAAPGCLQNIVKGIFDSLWGLLSLVWDVGRAAVRSLGEWSGILSRQERSSSERLMAAQQSGPTFISRFVSNPAQTMNTMINQMFNGIKEAAMNSYGCESWSGAPFVSRCLRPMSNWNCASCQQKLQLMCGVAGFAIGEIGTALLTGGLAAGAKFVAKAAVAGVRAGAQASRYSTLARGVIRTLPRPSPALSRAVASVGAGTARTLSAAERAAIRAFTALTNNPVSSAIARAGRAVDRSIVGQATRFTLRPAAFYLEALENAASLGFRSVDGALARATGRGAEVAGAARAAELRPDGLTEARAAVPPEGADVVTLDRAQVDELAGPAERNMSSRTVDGSDQIDLPSAPTSVNPNGGIVVGSGSPSSTVIPPRPVIAQGADVAPIINNTDLARVDIPGMTPEIRRIAAIEDPALRVEEGRLALGRESLTPAQQDAIIEAHNVGADSGRGVFEYTPEEKIRKGLILMRNGNFTREEAQILLDRGIAGSLSDSAYSITASQAFSDTRSLTSRARENSNSISNIAPGALRDERIALVRNQFREAAAGYAAEGARTNSAQLIGESWRLYARSGDASSAVRMMEEGVTRYGMNRPAVLKGIDDSITQANNAIANSSNPALVIARDTLVEARKRFAGTNPHVSPSATPQPRPQPVAEVRPPPPQPQPRPEAPAAPQPRTPASVTPREASQLANEYRLGTGGKPRDRRLASEYYYRASDDIARRELQRTRGFPNGDSRFMQDRNFSSAFEESLGSDGSVALRAVDDIYTTGGYKGLNAFLAENFQRFNTRNPSPEARANIRRFIDRLQEINKADNALYDPQRNYLRSWASANSE